jgi:ubiquinone/menaquinone biosynthesis C-methylase UbiE
MQNVELYSKNNDFQIFSAKIFYNHIGNLLKNYFKNREVSLLDVGSGCGRILTEVTIAESKLKFAKVVGVDKSENMIKFANKNYKSDLLSFYYMDAGYSIPIELKV